MREKRWWWRKGKGKRRRGVDTFVVKSNDTRANKEGRRRGGEIDLLIAFLNNGVCGRRGWESAGLVYSLDCVRN